MKKPKKEKNPEVIFKQRYDIFKGLVNDVFYACMPMTISDMQNIVDLCDDLKKYAKKTIKFNKLH